MKAGTPSAFGERLHTTAYTPKQEPSLSRPQCGLCCQRNSFYSATLLYTYISRFSVNPHYQQTRKSRQNCRHSSISNSFSTSRTNAPRSLSRVKAGTHATSAPNRTHSGLRGETRGVSDGGGIIALATSCTFTNIPESGVRKTYFAAFGSWLGALSKNTESLRNSDALMCVAVPRRRGPAGLRIHMP